MSIKKYMMMFVIVFIPLLCVAKHSDGYPIGVYSDITNDYVYNDCIGYIESGNFNYFRFGTSLHDNFDDADSRGLDVWFYDYVWTPRDSVIPDTMSPYLPSYATNFTYEAEQENENSPEDEACPDHYHYVFTRDDNCGGLEQIEDEGEYAWLCEESEHDAGYAVKDIYYKWSEGASKRLDHQISYKGKMKDLYVIFNMSLIPDVTIADTARICEVHAVCDTSGTGDYYTYTLVSTDTTYNTILRKEDFDSSGNFTQFEYEIAIKDVSAGNLLIPDECTGTNHLKNFNPRVYWFDKGDLWIDNITIEDDIYKKLKNGDYDSSLMAEFNLYTGIDNLISFNSVDEPMAPQFNAYKYIEDIIEDSVSWSYDTPGLLTAVNAFRWKETNKRYHHVNLFDYLGEPKNISTDIYSCFEAITFYEDIILNPDTILDSIYAVIDLSRTYLMMENSSKSYKGRLTYLIPNSVQDYRNLRGELLNNLLEIHYNE